MSAAGSRPLIIGVGNPMRRDDGVGIAAVAMLVDDARLEGVSIDIEAATGEPTRLVDAWRSREKVVVVDAAMAGARPGSIVRHEVGVDHLGDRHSPQSSHGAGVAEAIALAEALDRLPTRLVVVGVEPADLDVGEGLSPAVSAALGPLVDMVVAEVTP